MNVIIRSFSALTFYVCALTTISYSAIAQSARPFRTNAQNAPLRVNAQATPADTQQKTAQNLCASDTVEALLPPLVSKSSRSPLSYLAQLGFTKNSDGSWVCYVRDEQIHNRYYTLFKVQQVNGRLVASSFLESSTLTEGQKERSLNLFMTLIENHTQMNPGNYLSIQRYLESFISLIKQGKVSPSSRGYLFDQSSRGFVIYHPLTGGELQGTAITININSPQNLDSSPLSQGESPRGRV